jgi:hypothetical protein
MRTVPLVGLALLASCGAKEPATSSAPDMTAAAAIQDLAAPQDLPTKAMTGCKGLLACIAACAKGDKTCPATCRSDATAQALTLEKKLNDCVRRTCFDVGDAGDKPCMDKVAPSVACKMCEADAIASGGMCAADEAACLANLP